MQAKTHIVRAQRTSTLRNWAEPLVTEQRRGDVEQEAVEDGVDGEEEQSQGGASHWAIQA